MARTDTIVIGGGQAGLAVSRSLSDAGRDHLVLEQGRLAESWRSKRWDSLRLLSPNWMNHLPGLADDGADPDGFMTAGDLVSVLERYAATIAAPVEEQTTVQAVRRDAGGWTVGTDQGRWHARHLVVATGHCMAPSVPACATDLAPAVHQVTADRYRNPAALPDGGVLVVGAAATGLQLAEELARAGRDVVLSVGEHLRLPRRYRGVDILRWFRATGVLDDEITRHPDPAAAMRAPSLPLVGSPEHRDLDLATCRAVGVELTGRFVSAAGTQVCFAPTLHQNVRVADRRMHRTLDRIDDHIGRYGLIGEVAPAVRPAPLRVAPAPGAIDLAARGISTVVWATGHRRRYPWMPPEALDGRGEIRHRHGIGAVDGLYVVGLRFQRRRDSNFIGGVGRDARFIVDHLTGRSDTPEEVAA